MLVKREQLKKKLGEIVPFDQNIEGENYVIAYIDILPIKIKTDEKITQEEFDKMCEE